jgi:phosphate transport system substrate-binding protein
MKKLALVTVALMSSAAFAEKFSFQGSSTLGGVITDAIAEAGLGERLEYTAGGSGKGETALVEGTQGIAPMSREMKPEVLQQAANKGVQPIANVIALDGLSIFVKAGNPVASLDLATLNRIFTCEFTRWEQLPNANGKTGPIVAFRRNDDSGTTEAFKVFTGVKNFGACVTAVEENSDIADKTSRDDNAVGYAGGSAKTPDNRQVAIARTATDAAVLPTEQTVRDFSYPMARKLYVYEASGAQVPNEAEVELLMFLQDPSLMAPILQKHDFILENPL